MAQVQEALEFHQVLLVQQSQEVAVEVVVHTTTPDLDLVVLAEAVVVAAVALVQ